MSAEPPTRATASPEQGQRCPALPRAQVSAHFFSCPHLLPLPLPSCWVVFFEASLMLEVCAVLQGIAGSPFFSPLPLVQDVPPAL